MVFRKASAARNIDVQSSQKVAALGFQEIVHGGANGRQRNDTGRNLSFHEKGIADAQLGHVHGDLKEFAGNGGENPKLVVPSLGGNQLQKEGYKAKALRNEQSNM